MHPEIQEALNQAKRDRWEGGAAKEFSIGDLIFSVIGAVAAICVFAYSYGLAVAALGKVFAKYIPLVNIIAGILALILGIIFI